MRALRFSLQKLDSWWDTLHSRSLPCELYFAFGFGFSNIFLSTLKFPDYLHICLDLIAGSCHLLSRGNTIFPRSLRKSWYMKSRVCVITILMIVRLKLAACPFWLEWNCDVYRVGSAILWFLCFFSIQPNATTREKQLEAWGQLVLRYCNANNLYVADVTALGESELFNNRAINRESISLILFQ